MNQTTSQQSSQPIEVVLKRIWKDVSSKQTSDYKTPSKANSKISIQNDEETFMDQSDRNELLDNVARAGEEEEIDFEQ